MGKVKIELNLNGINELMKSPEVCSALQSAGEAVANAAGEDYGVRVHEADYVAVANVYPTTEKAYYDNLQDNTLLRAVGDVGLPTTKPIL